MSLFASHRRWTKILAIVLVLLTLGISIRFIFLKPKPVFADSTLGFNEGYGTTINDSNGNVTGTITNAVWKSEELCKVGKCLYFDGTGDLVSFGNDADVDFTTGSFTIEGWFRTPDITSGTRVLAVKYNSATGTDGGYKVYMDASGYVIFGIDNDQTSFPSDSVSTTTTAFDDNKWHHFAAVKSGTSSITLYVDGNQYQTDSTITASSLTNSDTFYVGIDGDGSSNGFSGFLDEVKVYSTTARTAAEIKADYSGQTKSRGTAASFGPDTSYLSNGLAGYWKMDESSGNAADSSGNGLTLTNNGTTTYLGGKFGNGSEHVPASSQYFSLSAGGTATYYIDASDAAATDPNVVWTNDANAFDGSTVTNATGTAEGNASSNYLKAEGTNAPGSGGTISQVRTRIYGDSTWGGGQCTLRADIYTNGLAENLGTAENVQSSAGWDSYTTLSTPSGGWSWSVVQALETKIFAFNDGACTFISANAYRVDIEVTTSDPSSISSAKTVSFWTNPDATTNYMVSLTSGAYITASSGTISATGFTSPTIYVNGVVSSTLTQNVWQLVTVTTETAINADTFYIGRQGNNYYDGTMDEVRVYNRALSPAEVAKLYAWAPGPLGYWKMDEASWTNNCSTDTVFDSSGNGFHGDACPNSTGPTGGTIGKFGKAGTFDGSEDYVTVPDNTSLEPTSLSVSAWVYRTGASDTSNGSAVVGKWAGAAGYLLYAEASSEIATFAIDGGPHLASGVAVPLNTWTHLAATFDGSTAKIYVNGTFMGSQSDTLSANAAALEIGRYAETNSTNWNGIIDDVMLYNYARTASQIIEDMNGGHPAPGSPIGSAVGYWKFDEGYSTTAYDSNQSTGGAENLTLSSATSAWSNSGKFGKAFYANGARWATIADDPDLDFAASEDISISLWMNSTIASAGNPSATEYIINKPPSGATNGGYAVYANTSGQICFGIDDDNTSFPEDSVCTSSDVYDNAWHNIVAVKTGTSRLDMYLDGRPNGTPDTSISSTVNTLANSSTLVVASEDTTDDTDDFNGYLDEMQIFRSAFTADQVKLEYNRGSGQQLGALSTNWTGSADVASNADLDAYCPPGQGSSCTGPIAEFTFDENTGTSSVNDTSTSGYTGTMNGSMTQSDWVPGKFGSALDFDGTDDYISCTDANCGGTTNLDMGTRDWSVSAWIKTNSTSGSFLVTKGGFACGGSPDVWTLEMNGTGTLRAAIHESGQTCKFTADDGVTINDNNWHHIAATWDRDGFLTRYIDGRVSGAALDISSLNGFTIDNTNAFNIARRDEGADPGYLTGRLDHIRIYNYVRTPAQVAWDYNRGGPVGHWKMDESSWNGTAGEVKDSSGNANHGVRAGDATTATGKYNNAGTFDNLGDYVSITNATALEITGDLTIAAWVKRSSSSAQDTIVDMALDGETEATNHLYHLYFDGSSFLNLIWEYSAGSNQTTQSSVAVSTPTGSWSHIAVTRNVTTNEVKYYENGIQLGTTQSFTNDPTGGTTANLILGAAGSTLADWPFDGLIDDVRLYNYVASPQQIKTILNEGAATRFGPQTGSP